MLHPDSDLTSFFKMLRCNISHFEVGKMQNCVSLSPCEPLEDMFLKSVF